MDKIFSRQNFKWVKVCESSWNLALDCISATMHLAYPIWLSKLTAYEDDNQPSVQKSCARKLKNGGVEIMTWTGESWRQYAQACICGRHRPWLPGQEPPSLKRSNITSYNISGHLDASISEASSQCLWQKWPGKRRTRRKHCRSPLHLDLCRRDLED